MPKYMIKASYNAQGIQGVIKAGGSARVTAVKQAVKKAGGKLESFYFAFGETDAYLILDMPDHASVAAVAAAAAGSGMLSKCETVVLLTAADIDEAGTKDVGYRAPGS
jgi:uncharacterized protein with GYD domain